MPALHKAAVIVAAWDSRENTALCIESIEAFMRGVCPYELIAVDNGSTDDTFEYLTIAGEDKAHWKIIHNEENLGTSRAYNMAMQCADDDTDTFFFVENDVVLTKDAPHILLDMLYRDDKVAAIEPLMNPRAYGQRAKVNEYDDFAGLSAYAKQVRLRGEGMMTAYHLQGACFMLKRSVAEEIGGFDEEVFPHSVEVMDYSLRILTAGYVCRIAQGAYVHHGDSSLALHHLYANEFYQEDYLVEKWGFNPKYYALCRKDVLSAVDMRKDNLHLLEIGCGAGGTLHAVREVNPDAKLFGVELNAGAARVASAFADVRLADVENMSEPEWEGKMDYLICADVLEHLNDSWTALSRLVKFLKIGGVAVISLPNVNHLSVLENLLKGRWEYEDAGILDKTHIRFFTKQTARELVEGANLRVLAIEPVRIMGNTSLQDELLRLKSVAVSKEELEAYQWRILAIREE